MVGTAIILVNADLIRLRGEIECLFERHFIVITTVDEFPPTTSLTHGVAEDLGARLLT